MSKHEHEKIPYEHAERLSEDSIPDIGAIRLPDTSDHLEQASDRPENKLRSFCIGLLAAVTVIGLSLALGILLLYIFIPRE